MHHRLRQPAALHRAPPLVSPLLLSDHSLAPSRRLCRRLHHQIDNYAELIRRGQPDLIEIKAVTYCGKSDGSSLTIQNSPWHEEVRKFAQAIVERVGDDYGLAAEHVHSTCVLVAKKKDMLIDGVWHTWIDYPKFDELIQRYYRDGTTFATKDYMARTPEWALFDAAEQGFDPLETRFRRTKTGKMVEIEYKASDSGCG